MKDETLKDTPNESPVDTGYRAAGCVSDVECQRTGFQYHCRRPASAIETSRSRVEAALHSERENVNAALEAAKEKAAKYAIRIQKLETALGTIGRLNRDICIDYVVKSALEIGS